MYHYVVTIVVNLQGYKKKNKKKPSDNITLIFIICLPLRIDRFTYYLQFSISLLTFIQSN